MAIKKNLNENGSQTDLFGLNQNIIVNNIVIIVIKHLISGNSLFKILTLGISEKVLTFL